MSEALSELKCIRCGGELQREGETDFVCPYCGKRYINQSVKKIEDALRGIIDDERQQSVANLRRLLWNEVNKEFVSNIEVERLCRQILSYMPEDFYANFYLATCSVQKDALDAFLNSVDVESRIDDIPDMLDYLLKALKPEWSMAVGCLIEKAYKDRDISLYNKYRTMYEKIYAAIEEGVFEPSLPRDVFVAYSSRDMAKVTSVVNEIERENLSCFVAARNLRHGSGSVENYRTAINTAIENCTVVVFVSSRSSRSIRCDAYSELNYIKELDKRTGKAKPRVEFLIENYTGTAMERFFTDFFKDLEYCVSEKSVTERVLEKIIENSSVNNPSLPHITAPIADTASTAGSDIRQKQQAEEERKRQQAIEAQRRAEEERKRQQEENRKRAEAEQQRKLAEEQKRQEENRIRRQMSEKQKRLAEAAKREKEEKRRLKEEKKNNLNPEQGKKVLSKRILFCSIAVVLAVVLVVVSVLVYLNQLWQKDAVTINDITYKSVYYEGYLDYYEVSEYDGSSTSVKIPEKVLGKKVKGISSYAFKDCTEIKSITIPDTVDYITGHAFLNCTSLESVNIPEGLDIIYSCTFQNCASLASIYIPGNIVKIEASAFYGCTSLTSVTFENSDGWYVNPLYNLSEDEDIGITFSDSATAATYLTDTYCDYYWHR